jgi:hypothetical protein
LVEFSKLTLLYPSSALPPQDFINAAPKCISGRTSYLRVRLAFHPYPQLIPAFCNRHGFGPPPRYYRGFNLSMGSSPGFGSNTDNTPAINERLATSFTSSTRLNTPEGIFQQESEIPQEASRSTSSRPIRTRFRYGSGTSIP